MHTEALAGYTVGVTAARRSAELGAALERHGARIVYGPAIRIVALADDSQLRAATERCLSAPLDLAIGTTGVGFRGWLEAARTWGLADRLTSTLEGATILARGPKVRGAIRAAGLREAWSPESESTAEVLAHLLASHALDGTRVAVQLHGDPLRELIDRLRARGAEVIEVPVYRWEPAADEQPLHRLIAATVAGDVDALTFTSAPAAVNVLRTADALGHGDALRVALRGRVLCAGVGPVTAAPLEQAGIAVTQPARARLGALAREVVRQLPARALVLHTAGHRLELRGQAVLVDDALVALSGAAMALLRRLATSRETLLATADDEGRAIDTLRGELGDPAIIQTVEHGYRLAVTAGPTAKW